jgi:hypothetical protein
VRASTISTSNPKNQVCTYEVYIDDQIRHLVKTAGEGQVQMSSNNVRCSVPEAMGHVAMEGQMQRDYGIDVMERLAAKLDRLRTRGTLGEQYIGEFDNTGLSTRLYLRDQSEWRVAVVSTSDCHSFRSLLRPTCARSRRKSHLLTGPKSALKQAARLEPPPLARVGWAICPGFQTGAALRVEPTRAEAPVREQGAGKVSDAVQRPEVTHQLDGQNLSELDGDSFAM